MDNNYMSGFLVFWLDNPNVPVFISQLPLKSVKAVLKSVKLTLKIGT